MKVKSILSAIDPLTVLIAILVAAFAYYLYLSLTGFNVKPYNMEGFEGADADAELYFVYATWCPHCKDILPAMKELAAKSPIDVDGKKIAVVLVESEEKEVIAALPVKVEGFPTFFLKKADGSVKEYHGDRTKAGLLEFIGQEM
jgi:thiol-disulfide isomerase/thioredoxin